MDNAPQQRSLEFQLWRQLMRQWCWAAVSSATGNYFAQSELWSQCEVATQVRQEPCCPMASSCDYPDSLESALNAVKCLRERINGPITVEDLISEIDSGYPVGVRIAWSGGGGHFVVVDGYRRSDEGVTLDVDDPWTGLVIIGYDALKDAYPDEGVWTHSYRTKAP